MTGIRPLLENELRRQVSTVENETNPAEAKRRRLLNIENMAADKTEDRQMVATFTV